jgi:hypothetical protein
MENKYYKIWFSNGAERTAGLVVDTVKFPWKTTSISDYSRLFPISECMKMKRLIKTTLYDSFEEAFLERAKAQDLLLSEVR